MYKFLMTLFLSAVTAFTALAQVQTPAGILSQLGARGIADHSDGTTNYAGFLIKLASNGIFDPSVIPASASNIVGTALTQLYFVDSKGSDTTLAGTPSLPFKTLTYALTRITTNAVIVFSPGLYAKATVTNANTTELTLIGYDSILTRIGDGSDAITFANTKAATVNIEGIHVDNIKQQTSLALTVNAYNRAIIDYVTRSYSGTFITLNSSPDTTVPFITGVSTTNTYMHVATRIGYIPLTPANWEYSITNVYDALNVLASYPKLHAAVDNGSFLYWKDGTWHTDLKGETYQMLMGGTSPVFTVISLSGAVYGPYTNTSLQTNIVDTVNIKDNAISTDKFSIATRNLLLTTNTPFGGDTTGNYNNIYVTGIRHMLVPVPTSGNDSNVLVYNHSGVSLGWQPYPGIGSVTNWSKYKAIQLVDMANNGLSNVQGIGLGGVYRTAWPVGGTGDVSTWSEYPATQTVNMASNTINNVGGIILNGVLVTNWNNLVGQWATYIASQNIDVNNFNLTNVFGITLGGLYRTNWPEVSNWSLYGAIQNVDVANLELTNVAAMTLGGERRITWPVETPGASRWSEYAATQIVDIANYTLNNVGGIVLGGVLQTNWPTGGGTGDVSTWSGYPATQNVDVANKELTNVTAITLNGDRRSSWPYYNVYRYFSRTNDGEVVEVLATSTNITTTFSASTFTFSIPSGTRLISAKMRVDGAKTSSGVIYLSMGTTDMNNSSAATDWMPLVQGYVENTLGNLTVLAKHDTIDPSLIKLTGLNYGGGNINNLRLGF